MFLNYYELAEQPFGMTADPRFLYMGSKHREALASLACGTESDRGFLAMIAKPGMGKTSILYKYLSTLRDKARTAFVFRTDCDSREFIKQVLLDLGVDVSGMDLPMMHNTLNTLMVQERQAGRRLVLVIDEAQNLDEKTLESIRLLSNFETQMLIILAGQPQLASKLANPSLSQLRQRISMVIRIEPFSQEEANAYIDHRLRIAGGKNPSLFTVGARKLIAEHSQGIPRNINNLCLNALSLGCALQQGKIDRGLISEVIVDLDLSSLEETKERSTATHPAPAREKGVSSTDLHLVTRYKNEVTSNSDADLLRQKNVVAGMTDKVSKPEAPIFSYAAKRESISFGWFYRPVIAIVLFLTLVGSTSEISRSESPYVDAPARIVVPVSATHIPTRDVDIEEPVIDHTSDSVRVMPGQTIYHISVEKYGNYDSTILEEIRRLNPWLSDPSHLQSGRELFIPPTTRILGDVQRTADDIGSPATAETERQ